MVSFESPAKIELSSLVCRSDDEALACKNYSRDEQNSQRLLHLKEMYFPLIFKVISRACFALTPAAPFIVYSVLLLVSS